MTYIEVGAEAIKEAELEFCGSTETALISLKVLDVIKECDPELSVKNVITILEDAKSLLIQIREI